MRPGATNEAGQQRRLEEESSKHGDLVQGDFLDTYHNLSYKEIMGNLWISEFCEQAEFVVKTDDDQFIDLYEVTTDSDNNHNKLTPQCDPNLYNVTPVFEHNICKR